VLLIVTIVKEPLSLKELRILSSLPKEFADKKNIIIEIVNICSSFLIIQYKTIYIVYQLVNDFL
jgi:hypothetical protein